MNEDRAARYLDMFHSLFFLDKMKQNDNRWSVVTDYFKSYVAKFWDQWEKLILWHIVLVLVEHCIASQKQHTADMFSEVIIGRCWKPDQLCIGK